MTSAEIKKLQDTNPSYGKTLIPVRTILEGALYLSARPLHISDLANLTGVSDSQVRSIIQELQTEYDTRLSAFTIVSLHEDSFVLQLRHELIPLLEKLAPDGLLSEPVLRTLGWIAYNQPINQSKLVKERGSGAYKHVNELKTKRFITSTRSKQTFILETTPMFADYFGFSRKKAVLKRQIIQWMQKQSNFKQDSPKNGE